MLVVSDESLSIEFCESEPFVVTAWLGWLGQLEIQVESPESMISPVWLSEILNVLTATASILVLVVAKAVTEALALPVRIYEFPRFCEAEFWPVVESRFWLLIILPELFWSMMAVSVWEDWVLLVEFDPLAETSANWLDERVGLELRLVF